MKEWVSKVRTPYAIALGEGRFEEYDTFETCEWVAFDRIRSGEDGVTILVLREHGAKSTVPARYLLPGKIVVLPAHYELSRHPFVGDFSMDIVLGEFMFFDGSTWRGLRP